MLYKSIRYQIKRGRPAAALVMALACAGMCAAVAFAIGSHPARPLNLIVTSQSTGSADISWEKQIGAESYEVGIWRAGLMQVLPFDTATADIQATPLLGEPSTATSGPGFYGYTTATAGSNHVSARVPGTPTQSGSGYGSNGAAITACEAAYPPGQYLRMRRNTSGQFVEIHTNGCYAARPGRGGGFSGSNSLYYWRAIWVSKNPVQLPNYLGAFSSTSAAVSQVTASTADDSFARVSLGGIDYFYTLQLTATATVTGIPAGLQYLSVRGVDAADNKGDWAYLVTVGTAADAPEHERGDPVPLSGIIYTDEVPNIEHYLLDETTLILHWQNIPGARHYDVRINGEVSRITAQGSSGQQVAVSLAEFEGENVAFQVRAVIETGSLDIRVRDADGELIYIVPPNVIVFSRWSADRSLNVERLGMIKGPEGTASLMEPKGDPDTIFTDIIKALLQLTTLMDDNPSDGEVQAWVLPIGLLGSIFFGGLTGYGARRGGLDKAAIVAGGLVFFVCWAYLCPVWLMIDWLYIFAVLILVLGAALVVVLTDFFGR